MSGRAAVLRGDALCLPLPDACVDEIVTSPPYWGLRSYEDGGQPVPGQLGGEPDWREYLENLWACTAEWVRVLKPGGSMWVNLGDKYSDRGHGPDRGNGTGRGPQGGAGLSQSRGVLEKSLLNLPGRYAIGCTDRFGLIERAEVIWEKGNPVPTSAADRVQRSHEHLFHLVKQPRYYWATDAIREPYENTKPRWMSPHQRVNHPNSGGHAGLSSNDTNPLGKIPGSVWRIPTVSLIAPAYYWRPAGGRVSWLRDDKDAWRWVRETGRDRSRVPRDDGTGELRVAPDHYAAMPPGLVRQVILGWSPPGICTSCGEGRRPVSSAVRTFDGEPADLPAWAAAADPLRTPNGAGHWRYRTDRRHLGWACACADASAWSRPAVVLDPCGGTGTVALVASMLGRIGLTLDLSHDYGLLAGWRINDPGERARVLEVPKPPPVPSGQGSLFDDLAVLTGGTPTNSAARLRSNRD